MCIGYPGRVIDLDATGATVVTEGRTRRASTVVVPDVRVGDWVTVAAGAIVARLEPADAAWIRRRLRAAERRAAAAGTRRTEPTPFADPRRP